MKDLAEFDTLSADQIDVMFDQLRTMQSRIRVAEVALLRAVDRRQIPFGDGMPSLESWTVGSLDVDPKTARHLIAVARADSAELDRLLVEDGLSFDRVSGLAKAGTTDPHLHLDMVGLKRSLGMRNRIAVSDERDAFESRFVSIQPSLDESSWKLWGLLPALEGKTVAATLGCGCR